MTSPLAGALLQVLPALGGKVFDYASDDDFERLWAFRDVPTDRILIVWSDTSPDSRLVPINTAAALSPVDWALAYVARKKEEPSAWPEVLILDLHPADSQSAPSVAYVKMLRPDQLPWMQVVDSATLSTIINWFSPKAPRAGDACRESLNRVLEEVRRNLTQTKPGAGADHHAVTNICGPMVLSRPKKDTPGRTAQEGVAGIPSPSAHTSALRAILEAAGAFRKGLSPEPLAIEDMKLVLIDDQASHGWESWLKACVPDEKAGQIIARSTPEDIFNFLESCCPRGGEPSAKSKDRRFRLVLPGCAIDDSSALLLDLRLFSGRVLEEKQFFGKLVELIGAWHFAATKEAGLAWNSLPWEDVEAVKKWVDEPPRSAKPADDVLLTLFPRFLALLDPSLPIVIFSTTLQRPLFEKLKDYGNIYTGLNKNPFMEGAEPIDYLRDILPTLKAFNVARRHFRSLDNVAAIKPEPPSITHWEIYIDEAGNADALDNFRVVGLLVGYESKVQADKIHGEMDALGIRWGGESDSAVWVSGCKWIGKVRNETGNLGLNKQWESIRDQLEKITESLAKYSFCLLRQKPVAEELSWTQPRLCNPGSLDNLYFSLLGDVLEAALFDVLGEVNSSREPSATVLVGARLRAYSMSSRAAPESERRCATDAWILEHRAKYADFGVSLHRQQNGFDPVYKALQMDGVLPVVSQLLERRRNHKLGERLGKGINSVAAVPMNQPAKRDPSGKAKFAGGELTSPPFRHLLFLADIAASLSTDTDYGVMTRSTFGFGPSNANENKALFARRQGGSQGFNALQRISRLLDPKDNNVVYAAWLFLEMGQSVEEIEKCGIFARSVLLRLKDALEHDLTGLELQQLAIAASSGSLGLVASPKATMARSATVYSGSRRVDPEKHNGQMQRRSVKIPGSGEPRGQSPCFTDEFKALQRLWRVKKFKNRAEYYRSNANWHTIPGYMVKETSSGKVRVFADLTALALAEVPGFQVPDNPSIFVNGIPRGHDLSSKRPQ